MLLTSPAAHTSLGSFTGTNKKKNSMLLTKPLGYSLNRFARYLAGVADVLLSTVAGAVSSPNRGHRPQETRRGCLYSGDVC